MEAYFDNSATTKVYPEVKDIMVKVLEEDFGNPSSLHVKGLNAEKYIKEATEIIAKSLKVDTKEIYFTSGGTESNNMAIIGAAIAHQRIGKHIITTAIEHASVHEAFEFLKRQGFEVTYVGTDESGKVDPEEVLSLVRPDTILVSIMYVNNEIGSIQPVDKIGKALKKKNPKTMFHIDAIQAYGKIPVYPRKLAADLVSISGHKIHGPKGSGALYVRSENTNNVIKPIIYGGGQQRHMRSGTENVPAIAGLGVAARKSFENFEDKVSHMTMLRDRLVEGLTAIDEVYSNTQDAPHIASISFTGVRSEVMLHTLEDKGIYVSAGSACSSNDNKKKVSGVLAAINLPKERLESTLRFSFSEDNTIEQVDYAVEVIKELLPVMRKYVRK